MQSCQQITVLFPDAPLKLPLGSIWLSWINNLDYRGPSDQNGPVPRQLSETLRQRHKNPFDWVPRAARPVRWICWQWQTLPLTKLQTNIVMRLRAVLSVGQSVWPLLSRRTVWSPSEDCIKLCLTRAQGRRTIKNRPSRTAPAVTMECFHTKKQQNFIVLEITCVKNDILYITNVSLFLTSRRRKLVLLFQLLCLLTTAFQGVCRKIVLFIILLLFRRISATSIIGVYFWLGTLLIGDQTRLFMETCFYVQEDENNWLNPEGCRSGFK